MSWTVMRRRTRFDIIRAMVLVGLTSAVAVYFTAADPADNALGSLQDTSKVYRRTLEMVGGTANLVASDITDWVAGLWHGRALAGTLAVLTLVLAYGFYLITEDAAPPA